MKEVCNALIHFQSKTATNMKIALCTSLLLHNPLEGGEKKNTVV